MLTAQMPLPYGPWHKGTEQLLLQRAAFTREKGESTTDMKLAAEKERRKEKGGRGCWRVDGGRKDATQRERLHFKQEACGTMASGDRWRIQPQCRCMGWGGSWTVRVGQGGWWMS